MKNLFMLIAASFIMTLAACSSTEDEPKVPENEEQSSQGVTDRTEENEKEDNSSSDNTDVTVYPSKEIFEEAIVGKYWYYYDTKKYYENGEVYIPSESVSGNYGLLAFRIDPNGTMREYQAFSMCYFESSECQYDEKTGWITTSSNTYGPFKVEKIEDGKLYVTYHYDETFPTDDLNGWQKGIYTYTVFRAATTKEIKDLNNIFRPYH